MSDKELNEDEVEVDLASSKRGHKLVSGILLLLICALVGTLWLGLIQDPNATPVALLSKKGKDFKVSWLQGQEHVQNPVEILRMEDFKGKPLVLNFWASWCVSCRQEAALMEQYWKAYQERGVYFVGIAIHDTTENALKFAKYYGKTYILGLDEGGSAGIDYGVTGVPETFFIDTKGVIQHKEAGPITPALMEKMLPKIMN